MTWLSTEQAAKLEGCSERTLRRNKDRYELRLVNGADKAHIGIVYAGNPSVLKRMYGRKAEEFDQVYSRTTYKCPLNNAFTKSDISAIYEGFCFSNECLDYLWRISKRQGGLRLMVNQCQIAQNIALRTNCGWRSRDALFAVSKLLCGWP